MIVDGITSGSSQYHKCDYCGNYHTLYDDNSTLPVICGHGGSAWFCYDCAVKLIELQKE